MTNHNHHHHHKIIHHHLLPPHTTTTRSNSTIQACAACRYQRRKCAPDCILAPYFPHDRQRQFQNAHKLFGVSNITKIIRHLDPPHKHEAMRTIIYQSDVRALDPVGGCYRIIRELQRQIDAYCSDLEIVLQQLALCRTLAVQNHTQNHPHLNHDHDQIVIDEANCDIQLVNNSDDLHLYDDPAASDADQHHRRSVDHDIDLSNMPLQQEREDHDRFMIRKQDLKQLALRRTLTVQNNTQNHPNLNHDQIVIDNVDCDIQLVNSSDDLHLYDDPAAAAADRHYRRSVDLDIDLNNMSLRQEREDHDRFIIGKQDLKEDDGAAVPVQSWAAVHDSSPPSSSTDCFEVKPQPLHASVCDEFKSLLLDDIPPGDKSEFKFEFKASEENHKVIIKEENEDKDVTLTTIKDYKATQIEGE